MISHPAKYSDSLLGCFSEMLSGRKRVIDPFAGTGKIFSIFLPGAVIVAVEIEPEWARMSKSVVGDCLALPFRDSFFDAVCTSPTYGNRMADTLIDRYKRITYTSYLGRRLNPNNSGSMQWGEGYRVFHARAWREVSRVLSVGGLFVLNIKNHIRAGVEIPVSEWHVQELESIGFRVCEHRKIKTPSMRFGKNGDKRIDHENVFKLVKDSNATGFSSPRI